MSQAGQNLCVHNDIWVASWQNQQNDCASREESEQPGHLLCAQWIGKDSSFLHADSEDSDQTGRMPRLIQVFAGHTGHIVSFVMRRLIGVLQRHSMSIHMWRSFGSLPIHTCQKLLTEICEIRQFCKGDLIKFCGIFTLELPQRVKILYLNVISLW